MTVTLPLWKQTPGFDSTLGAAPQLTLYPVNANYPTGAVIICPGGGYHHRAFHEGEPVAQWLNRLGLAALVLDYRVAPYRFPYPILDGLRAVRYVRTHAAELQIDPQKIVMLGFSAGGHLAATVGNYSDHSPLAAAVNCHSRDGIDRADHRPNGLILAYPVVSFQEFAHQGSIQQLLGAPPDPHWLTVLSNHRQVTSATPPTFLWHTADDASVPVENSLELATALRKANVSLEFHIFPHGRHGLGLAAESPQVAHWTTLCANWLRTMNFIGIE